MFRYVSLWSQASTWGYQFAPVAGESLSVPRGLHLLVDIDTSPHLNLVIVEGGSIIFPCNEADPDHLRKFDANYIFLHEGYMEVGTEFEPYCSKIEITMHGSKQDASMPLYGNKCIGVRYGTLDMHGMDPGVTWTQLRLTAYAGEDVLSVSPDVDISRWQPGDEIIVTSTAFTARDYAHPENSVDETEKHIVRWANWNNNTVVIVGRLAYDHYGAEDTYYLYA